MKNKTLRLKQVLSLLILTLTAPALAQISIQGVSDRTFYTDSASFTVNSEPGYDYTCDLNGTPVATDTTVNVNQPDYYELNVRRQNQTTAEEETRLVRFIIRAGQRGSSESGLPPFVPTPLIDSAQAEFTGANLIIVTPAQYPLNLDIPVVARIENDSKKRLGVNGRITADGFTDHPLQLLRGVGSVILPAAAESGAITYDAQIKSLQTQKQIEIEATTTWQNIATDITTSTDWPENSRIHITDSITITADQTLTIGAGSVIMIDPDLEIAVNGNIIVNGTPQIPVVFTPTEKTSYWGGFLFETAQSIGQFSNTILTGSGADSSWFSNNSGKGSSHRKNQCLFYLSNGANVNLENCYMIENHGQAGHGESSNLTMTGCLVQKCVTGGQYNGDGSVVCTDTALIEFPSATAPFTDNDNDAFYLTGGAHSFTDCLIGWAHDDGIDAGSGSAGSVIVDNCWFEACYHEAQAWSKNRDADVTDSVTINSGQGIECGYDDPDVNAVHCLSTANLVGARFGDNYDWSYDGFLTVTDSLLIYNYRDVWGQAWDDWSAHLDQMDIQNNYLSIPNPNFPNNTQWDPINNPTQADLLIPFLAAPADTVGIAIATHQDTLDLSQITGQIPVGLSSFTTKPVSVNYSIYTDNTLYDSGTLQFAPGQTINNINFQIPPIEDLQKIILTISNPLNAQLTGLQQIKWHTPYDPAKKLIAEGDDWQYFKGTEEPPADWNQLTFDDTQWLTGPTGIGYEGGSGLDPCLATNLTDMRDNYLSVYARRTFTIDDPANIDTLTLDIKFDDGYIAYINGEKVDSQYPPLTVAYDQPASTDDHEASCSGSGDQIDLTDHLALLVPGENVFAIQVHNKSRGSSDFIFIPQLTCQIAPTPGDFQPDGNVDLQDFATLTAAWQTQQGQPDYNPTCDISTPKDAIINLKDLNIFIKNWLASE